MRAATSCKKSVSSENINADPDNLTSNGLCKISMVESGL